MNSHLPGKGAKVENQISRTQRPTANIYAFFISFTPSPILAS
jgi:hypothetical protein